MIVRKRKPGCCTGRRSTAGFGAFGAPSYVSAGVDCPPDDTSGGWERWCDCMFDGEERQRCRSHYCVAFNPFNPGDCSYDIRKSAAPWTDVGAGARNIRKVGAGLLYGVTQAVSLPSIEEYDPEKLMVTAITDPPYFGKLTAVSALVSYSFGSLYMAQFIPPQAFATGWPLAISLSMGRGGVERVWDKLLKPIAMAHFEWSMAVLTYGPSGAVMYGIRQQANRMPDGVPKAVLLALSTKVGLFDSFKAAGANAFKNEGVWFDMGQAMVELVEAGAIPPGNFANTVIVHGRMMMTYSIALARLVAVRLIDALDAAFTSTFGFSYSNFKAGVIDITKASPKQDGVDTFKQLGNGIDSVSKAMSSMNWKPLSDLLSNIISDASSMISEVGRVLGLFQVQGIAPVPSITAAPSATTSSLTITAGRAGRSFTYPVTPTVTVAPPVVVPPPPSLPKPRAAEVAKPKSIAVPALIGGSAGLVGGPAGALIGAGAGTLVGLFRRFKG